MKNNKEKLVKISVQGKVCHALGGEQRVTYNGEPSVIPALGGIVYNVKVGDFCFGLVGDHIEPGVSIKNKNSEENSALNTFSCIGNEATIITGDAKGGKGYVTGKHGGVDNVIIFFDQEDIEKLVVGDEILIKACGQGLRLEDYNDIVIQNIDPRLFERLGIKEIDGNLHVDVVARIPAYMMGSGLGSRHSYSGDYDMMCADLESVKKAGVENLRFGDIVLLEDADNTYGRGYLKGATSIGVVIHGDSYLAGHGPGITTIMTCKKPRIKGVINDKANIANYYQEIKS